MFIYVFINFKCTSVVIFPVINPITLCYVQGRLLITFENSLNLGQARLNAGPDHSESKLFDTLTVFLEVFLRKKIHDFEKKSADDNKGIKK